jgi:hypothetical protein
MRKKMRSIRNVVNESGTISNRVRLNVKVHLDFGDPQNIVDGVPDLTFSVGDLRLEAKGNPRISSPSLSRTPTILAGGSIQTTMRLTGPSAFTLISAVKEIHISKPDVVA